MLVGTNFALSGRVAWTPGGYGIVFARMLEDGIVARYLEEHCPQTQFKLCPYRHRFPRTADEFLWNAGPFNELGRFDGLGEEMRSIVLGSLAEYPGQQIETAAVAAARQLVKVENGEGVLTTIWHTYGIIEHYMPSIVPAMRAARQQHGEVSFRALNEVQVPVALISIMLLPFIVMMGRGDYADLRRLAATVERRGACQCRRMRRPVEPARPLWRADCLDRKLCRRARPDALCRAAALEGDRGRGMMHPPPAPGVCPACADILLRCPCAAAVC